MQLAGKTIVITGAESGIGQAIALECGRNGAFVVAAGLQEDGLRATAEQIGAEGGRASWMRADITAPDDVQKLMAHAREGGRRLDGVVANAGISGVKTPCHEVRLEDFRKIVEVNLVGTFLTMQAAAQVMIEQGGGGSIIATGSSTAVRVMPGLLPYVATKGGVHAMAELMALELAPHRIRVNTLVPGTTATPLVRALPGHIEATAKTLPMGEVVEPEELARYVVFALSDAAPHLTGSHLKIDSGRTIA